MESDAEQQALTQIAYRAANEAISRRARARRGARFFLCECADETCRSYVELTAPEYEQVRSDPRVFALAAGHEREDDLVMERSERFNLIRKTGVAAGLAGAFDPRGGG